MPILLKEDRKYPRLKHTRTERTVLSREGFRPVISSNVSAIAKENNSLLVRFHGGATYEYPKSGKLYWDMVKSSSKGKFVWRELIRKHVPYRKIGSISLEGDVEDRDMMLAELEERKGKGETLLQAIALTTMISNEEAIATGMIAGLVLASEINSNATTNAE